MEIEFECQYCGHKWFKSFAGKLSVFNELVCVKCKDHNVKYKDLSKSKIDYYQGSPPFEDEDIGWPF